MASEFGKLLRVSVFGQSHGTAIGVLMDGLPAGEELNLTELQTFLNRRRARADGVSTTRREADVPRFLSGLTFPKPGAGTNKETDTKTGGENGGDPNGEVARTCGAPLCAVLDNTDQRSGDYDNLRAAPRPGHADYTAWVKWGGFADMRGGGHFSGRLTAPLCVAGGIAKQLLARQGIYVGAVLTSVGEAEGRGFPCMDLELPALLEQFRAVAAKPFPALDEEAEQRMRSAVASCGEDDSVGGVVQCVAVGLPAGLGEPMFDGIESRLAAAIFGIPAVKGVEFGEGFRAARLRGSQNNDPFIIRDGRVVTAANHSGGILGGITTGMPLEFRAAFKPTPSISRPQRTVNLQTMEETELRIRGRHDKCVAVRAVPVVEAVTACVLLDLLLEGNHGVLGTESAD